MGRMKLAQRGVVELVPADLKIPLLAIERVCGVVVKSTDGFDTCIGRSHRHGELDRRSTGDLGPSLTQALLIEKHDFELFNLMFLDVALSACAAGEQCHG